MSVSNILLVLNETVHLKSQSINDKHQKLITVKVTDVLTFIYILWFTDFAQLMVNYGGYRLCVMNIFAFRNDVSVAQLDARPTGDQEAAKSTPAGSAAFFCGN